VSTFEYIYIQIVGTCHYDAVVIFQTTLPKPENDRQRVLRRPVSKARYHITLAKDLNVAIQEVMGCSEALCNCCDHQLKPAGSLLP